MSKDKVMTPLNNRKADGDVVAGLLEDARKVIDSQRDRISHLLERVSDQTEQIVIMRKIIELISEDDISQVDEETGYLSRLCAWCGYAQDHSGNAIEHEDNCLVVSAQILLKTLS